MEHKEKAIETRVVKTTPIIIINFKEFTKTYLLKKQINKKEIVIKI